MDRVNMFLSFRRIVITSIFTIALCFAGSAGLLAQEGEDLVDPVTSAATEVAENSGAQGSQNRVLELLFTGDPLGIAIIALIILLSFVSVYFIIEHMLSISKRKLMPEDVLAELEQRIARGEINQAIEFCYQPENYSLISDVILAGLERYQSSEFGFAEYKSAVEEAGEDFTGRLYRKTEVLNVIGQISPMLGLTGTVLGMISAFMTIAEKEGMAKPEELAGGIGEALITTLLGLLVAIPTLVALSYFRNKIDSLVAEAGKRVERALLPLARKRS
ncbi:MAG: MotA/TolQ/ExbB proton channel family protein [Planctomycetota bacterium]|nr:MotA/TolQ/ExbB proton channel family protein [Planctomycetota bacterium]